jgi:hypothetical protein
MLFCSIVSLFRLPALLDCFVDCSSERWPFFGCNTDLAVAIMVLLDLDELASDFIDDFDVRHRLGKDRLVLWSVDPFNRSQFHTFSVSDLKYRFRSFGSTDRMYWIAKQALMLAVCSQFSLLS